MTLVEFAEPPHMSTLAECEAIIESGLQSFVDVGDAITKISIDKLYREAGYDTFDAYCRERWQISRGYGYRMMTAAATHRVLVETLAEVSPTGDIPIPTNERQIRSLVAVPDEQKAEVWTVAVDLADGEQPTAAQVEQAVAAVNAPTIPADVDPETGEILDNESDDEPDAPEDDENEVAAQVLHDMIANDTEIRRLDVQRDVLKAVGDVRRVLITKYPADDIGEYLDGETLDHVSWLLTEIGEWLSALRQAHSGLRVLTGGKS